MKVFSKIWWLSTLERAAKTFFQAYIGFWVLAAGLGSTPTEVPNADAFDLLFTWDNVKAAVVVTVLSLASSVVSTPLGADKSAPSLTVTETVPTAPPLTG
jgi:hypothetical protein